MCGIAGFIWRDPGRPAVLEPIAAMCDILAHRGPDDEGIYLDGPVALGQRRLSILDLSPAGHQPMVSDDGRLVLTFNGEIYNYVELRTVLVGMGHRFRSDGDTEVILAAYRAWGLDCVKRFNGMWAFALYDRDRQEVFLSRDRFGIKPFYYVHDGEAFAFASEIKALLAVRPQHRRVRQNYLARFIVNGSLDDGPETCFEGVHSLPPAHSAIYDIDQQNLTLRQHWTIELQQFAAMWQRHDPVETMASLLDSAVRLHIRSDVPVGSCLSGGIDSSALVCLMSRHHHQPVRTFSGLYADPEFNEEEYVDAINGHVPTVPFPIRPEPHGDLVDDLTKITWHQDEPTAGPGLYTQFHVMRRAAPEVKVLLDGQGSDELFAGYLFYLRSHVQDLVNRRTLRDRMHAMGLVASANWHWPGVLEAGWRILGHRLLHGGAWLVNSLRSPAPQVLPANPLHPGMRRLLESEPIQRTPAGSARGVLQGVLEDQLVHSSIPALLHYEDRNSMAYSIEARVPFLDYRIVEFALSLDPSYKIRGSWTKWILRQATADLMPPKVTWRRSKFGYPTPMAHWLRRDPDREHVRSILFSREHWQRELVDPATLEWLWRQHQAGKDYSWILYRLLTTELWHRHYIDAFVPYPAVTPRLLAARKVARGEQRRLAS
jgi:asparagine synthase (glutamine-hydrolysing)